MMAWVVLVGNGWWLGSAGRWLGKWLRAVVCEAFEKANMVSSQRVASRERRLQIAWGCRLLGVAEKGDCLGLQIERGETFF